jgi:phthiocerol/phenolphthiocerol synthesis type-I polyketide synthase E
VTELPTAPGAELASLGETDQSLDIAIIGMAARFPGARDLQSFWGNLVEGRCAVTRLDESDTATCGGRVNTAGDDRYVPMAYVIEDSDKFDAAFFGYSPREAELMDPQHRVLLECAWAAAEDAGLDLDRSGATCGVFAGAGHNTYLRANVAAYAEIAALMGDKQVLIGNRADFLCSRISYKLGLEGPSMTVQTACSTSLVAVVQACQALLAYHCDAALAGGVAIDPQRHNGYVYRKDGILSPDGLTRTFDVGARGTVGGDGVGIIVVKRLHDALVDRDHIYAVIKGGAVNNDGARRVGFSAPSADAQAAVIVDALANANVEPRTVRYLELHGTATNLGDAVEMSALRSAYQDVPVGTCALGSVKTNIGHLDAAAGVAGLIKTVLAVERGIIPPSLNFYRPNPRLRLNDSPFWVNTETLDWPADEPGPRRAAVSSFGLGGTNAHVILEQAPAPTREPESGQAELVVMSARSGQALQAATDRLERRLRGDASLRLDDVAWTLRGRRAFGCRRAFVARSRDEALAVLDNPNDGRLLTAAPGEGARRPVAFLFPGFGSQRAGMAREFYEQEPVFRSALDQCAELATPTLGADLRDSLLREAEPEAAARQRSLVAAPAVGAIDHPELGYPAVFAFEYALARVWQSWSVQPTAMIGHSLGEYVAACLAGVFTLPDALRLVIERARLMTRHGRGAMLAVPLPEQEVAEYLDDAVSIAAVNDPCTCVLSGSEKAIAKVEARLDKDHLVSRRLASPYAFHSPLMAPVVEPYHELVADVALRAPDIPFVSNITGDWITAEQAVSPNYWAAHLREPVRFADGVAALCGTPDIVLLEIGPGQSLTAGALQHPAAQDAAGLVAVPSLPDTQPGTEGRSALLRAAARLWLAGVERPFPPTSSAAHVPLPTYPFERHRYWLDSDPAAAPTIGAAALPRAGHGKWWYSTTWRREVSVPTTDPDVIAAARWLVFQDNAGVGGALAELLREFGAHVDVVKAGGGFAAADSDADLPTWTVDPAEPEHYRRLAKMLRGREQFPTRIVHCWGVDPVPTPLSADGIGAVLRHGFDSVLAWVQAAEAELTNASLCIDVVGSGACEVLGDESLCPPKAATQGLARVMQQEYPAVVCVHTDVRLNDGYAPAELAAYLLPGLCAEPGARVVALRGRHRWLPGYGPFTPSPRSKPAVRRDGVYLVTGGLGKIGLLVARALAETERVRLVLLGRVGLPDRDHWDEKHSTQMAAAIAAVRGLEASGSTVRVVAADVSDADRMRDVVEDVVSEFGAVHGVVHCAGTTGEDAHRAIADLGHTEANWHFAPKVYGAQVLAEVLADQRLDIALLCSSVASLLGGLGFGAYAAANACLDTFALANHSDGHPWCSVNWEAWHFDAVTSATRVGTNERGLGAAVRELALTPEEGRRLFETLFDSVPQPQVVVSTGDLNRRQELWSAPDVETVLAERHVRPNLSNPYVAANTESEERIAAIWQEILGVDRVGVHDNFFELGGNSLLGLQVVHRLRKRLGRAVPLTVVYEGPTVRTLAEIIDRAGA